MNKPSRTYPPELRVWRNRLLYGAVCADGGVDLIDFEMILSYQNFQETPGLESIRQRFEQAQRQQADRGKVAILPRTLDDVLEDVRAAIGIVRKTIASG